MGIVYIGHKTSLGLDRYIHGFPKPLALREAAYELSEPEVSKFVRFWKGFRKTMQQPRHYLQLPIRRLHSAGDRREMEDALVDCVIGLEALLGMVDERTELSYRFRIRGSVLLAKIKADRKNHIETLRSLYDLRSRIVHGQLVSDKELERMLPIAEDSLRRIWSWFFKNYRDFKSNKPAILKIDATLVS